MAAFLAHYYCLPDEDHHMRLLQDCYHARTVAEVS